MRIRVGRRETKQIVYVSENTSGFYLSESGLEDLDLTHYNFPNQMSATINEKAMRGNPHKTTVF